MNRQRVRTVYWRWMLFGSGVLLLGACRGTSDKPSVPDVGPLRIAQFGYGSAARFARCSVMTCPTVTPKHQGDAPRTSRLAQVTFAFGSIRLDESARAVLDALAQHLTNAQQLHLDGYADKLGPQAVNLELSQQRAQAVGDYLLRATPRPEFTVRVNGHGACCFVAPNTTAEGRAENRRVEILIDYRSRS